MNRVQVNPDDVLVFDPDNERLDLPLPQLRSIVGSASRLSHAVYDYVNGINNHSSARQAARGRANAMRKLATIRDSMGEMVTLLAGEDLDEPKRDRWATSDAPPWDMLGLVLDTDQAAVNTAAAAVDIEHGDEFLVNPPSKYDEMPEGTADAFTQKLKTVLEVEEEYALREAEIFKRIKDVQYAGFVNEDVKRRLQEILDYIRERQDG